MSSWLPLVASGEYGWYRNDRIIVALMPLVSFAMMASSIGTMIIHGRPQLSDYAALLVMLAMMYFSWMCLIQAIRSAILKEDGTIGDDGSGQVPKP